MFFLGEYMSLSPDFDLRFFEGVIHNDLHLSGDHSKVGFISVDQLPRHNFLNQAIAQDFQATGLSPDILRGVRTVEFGGNILPSHLGVEQAVRINERDMGVMRVIMAIEPEYVDGKQRPWDARVFVFPVSLTIGDDQVEPLGIMQEIGYHVLIKQAQEDMATPLVRIDSLCVTSMLDGHFATAGDAHLGCDCEPQRHFAQDLILDNPGGGISLLSPLSGRANGTAVHSGQIAMQNFAVRHGLELPDTLQSHQLQGVPADARGQYYWIDAAILAMFPAFNKMTLLANNPQKVEALRQAGFEVEQQPLHVASRATYYEGLNFLAKAAIGHI